eukprot:UN02717
MGQTCCSSDEGNAAQQTAPDIITKQPQRPQKIVQTEDSNTSKSTQSTPLKNEFVDENIQSEPGQLPESQQTILDNMELKKLSMDLLKENNGAFVKFANKHLEKILNKVWPKVDSDKKGYIETSDQIAEAITFILMIYKGSRKQKAKKQEMLNQLQHIVIWIVTKYGQQDVHTTNEEYVFRLTENEFKNNLKKWMDEYVESDAS